KAGTALARLSERERESTELARVLEPAMLAVDVDADETDTAHDDREGGCSLLVRVERATRQELSSQVARHELRLPLVSGVGGVSLVPATVQAPAPLGLTALVGTHESHVLRPVV